MGPLSFKAYWEQGLEDCHSELIRLGPMKRYLATHPKVDVFFCQEHHLPVWG